MVGEAGILLLGPSGAGKSSVARRLIEETGREGGFAALVGDDRILLEVQGGRLLARPVPAIAGLLEVRGVGIVLLPHEPVCVVRLAVELRATADIPRLPEPSEACFTRPNVSLPRVFAAPQDAVSLVRWRIRGGSDTIMTE